MNQLQVFNFTGKEVRVIMKDGHPWWVAKDVCSVLDHSDVSMAVKRLDEDEKLTQTLFVSGQNRNVWFVNEPGLYSLILTSRKPESKKFKRWVTHEVLPAIRQTGIYSLSAAPSYMIDDPIKRAEQWIREYKEKQEAQTKALMLEQRVAEYEPKITYLDRILQSKGTVTITQIAKDYEMSGQALNQILHEERVQYKQNGQWLLYREHHDKGYTKSETIDIRRRNGDQDVTMNTRWTQKGRLFIHEILKRRGIVPVMDREKKGVIA
ncbi:putative prophage antirepressor [Paenibacillus larvae subsp. larvae]|uniref:KilAC domain antirepressor n=10 Tax=root TaxID=1 RepID=A0A345ASI9_9CAUD|nr:phage antirepressor KilAC domain-containing protein [Paenibacillus larvae]YP_010082199.1 anti-repressor Ant [Paenibacillus phage C7Cdelta]YP_010082292.1 anti-repressor Ant [Paenibacillus phage Halcyone]YP_010082383.1 anti-repressor Ant [Paenibacillus phage Scottie]YP_010082461.1 anti-repressor Ant [Paenibacillus phage Unity]AXF39959.1 KilAC domain antirepressor [Paenibacillus phage Ash]AXF40246.1 KilAC domain antirepressor [Paenibacillus phage Ley]AXF40993.1 KilAC domain BRO family antire